MEITPVMLQAFRKDFDQAIKELASKYDITIECGKIKYTSNTFTATVEAKAVGVDHNKANFDQYALYFGFKPADYNKQVSLNGKQFQFIGFNPTRPKWRCQVRNIHTGETAAVTEDCMHRLLAKAIN